MGTGSNRTPRPTSLSFRQPDKTRPLHTTRRACNNQIALAAAATTPAVRKAVSLTGIFLYRPRSAAFHRIWPLPLEACAVFSQGIWRPLLEIAIRDNNSLDLKIDKAGRSARLFGGAVGIA